MTKTASLQERKLIHTRRIICMAYERSDGLLDIEGTLIDTKPSEILMPERGKIESDEPIHEMTLRLTISRDLLIHEVSAITLNSPYQVCNTINDSYKQLIGARIGPGFIQSAKKLFRDRAGCSHLTELLSPIATTAFQALWGDPVQTLKEVLEGKINSPFDGCHALRSDGDVAKIHFPDFYKAAMP